MRKQFTLLAVLFVTLCFSCKKNSSCDFHESNRTAPAGEQTALLDSLQKYNLNAILHPAGFYYKVVNEGTGDVVSNLCSDITSTYWGGYFNGKGFDSTSTPITFPLGQTILGWQKGIPMVKGGGEIYLYIPPSLAYGAEGLGIIPGYAYLVFKIKVIKIE